MGRYNCNHPPIPKGQPTMKTLARSVPSVSGNSAEAEPDTSERKYDARERFPGQKDRKAQL